MSTTTPPGPERRQYKRAALRGIAHLVLTGHPSIEVRTVDISVGGMGIVASANPPAGLACVIRVVIPVKPRGTTTVEVQAKVAHSIFSHGAGGFLIGLEFSQLSAEAKSAVMQLG